jgi:hypothetical protein
MTRKMEERMKEDFKKLTKEEMECVRGSAVKTLRPPAIERDSTVIAASLCGGSDSCVAIIHVPKE